MDELTERSRDETAARAKKAKAPARDAQVAQANDRFSEIAAKSEFKTNLPEVKLPPSGGAIRGMGEKFSVAPATGTGTLTVPLPFAAARMPPSLALSYNSGAGNGVFGFGWSLDAPAIRRKTDKGLPKYDDIGESDIYILSGAEDLTPLLDGKGVRVTRKRTVFGADYEIAYYRPRVEGLFARIERWRASATGLTHWRSITRDNVTTVYGETAASCIADPADATRIFEWRISRTFNDRGDVAAFVYRREDGAAIDFSLAQETNRAPPQRAAQIYLRKILYGPRTPYFVDYAAEAAPADPADWMFAASLDYGDHPGSAPDPDGVWTVRPDPFSSYRSGFEIRTYRRVRRLLFFNNFPADPSVGAYGLVRSLDLAYADEAAPPGAQGPIYSFLASVTQTGHRTDADDAHTRSLPPLEFTYAQATLDPAIHSVAPDSLADLPEGVDGARHRWLDLDGEGLSGILTPALGAWYFKRNLSADNIPEGADRPSPRFGPMREIAGTPGHGDAGRAQFLALDGDGMIDVAELSGGEPGFYMRTPERDFAPFQRFRSLPQIDWRDPNLKFIDVTGDGLADALVTEDGLFTYYASLGSEGFDCAAFVRTPSDEEKGPRVVFADGTDTIFVADMTGDGLNDIVRVRNGETAYWPNLGYGRFGAKVTMDAAPRFDSQDAFDGKRIRLVDIDGSGAADVLYVGRDGVRVWFNRSGNAFSAPTRLAVFPAADALESVQTTDLLGTGTAYLVWSSPLPGNAGAPLLYVDLMGGVKPHLMTSVRNNLGAETRTTYAPSTRFYLADERAGRPWVTRLPFPVWTVARVEIFDWIGRNRLVQSYAYHHGFFDGLEREFRGFGMVETWDSEEFRADTKFDDGPSANWSPDSTMTPILTRTWLHTGAFLDAQKVTRQYEGEYWLEPALRGPPAATGLAAMRPADTALPAGLDPFTLREAYRALKGRPLRVEVFDASAPGPAGNPYSVVESNYALTCLQPIGPNKHAAFFVRPCETVTLAYERGPRDPRVTHEVTLEANAYGDVTRALSIGYPRRAGPAPEPGLDAATQGRLGYDQSRLHMRGLARTHTNALDDIDAAPDVYRAPVAAAVDIAEITGVAPSDKGFGAASLFAYDELDGAAGVWTKVWSGAADVAYEAIPGADVDGAGTTAATPTRRFVGKTRSRYRSDDLATLLPVGQLQSRAVAGVAYHAAVTPGQIVAAFGGLVTPAVLAEGGYVQLPGEAEWWSPSGQTYLSPGDADTPAQELAYATAHFFFAQRLVDPFGNVSRIAYDANTLLPVSATDPVGNVTSSVNDYRVLAPAQVTDANGNRVFVAFDALGLVVATAAAGKTTETLGDLLTGFTADLDDASLAAFFADPIGESPALIGSATTRVVADVAAYYRTRASAQPSPPAVGAIARETHVADLAGGVPSALQISIAFNDGLGRVAQKKAKVADGPLADGGATVSPRWLGSGWTIFNNKGLPVRTYEPFFTAASGFEFAAQSGVATLTLYDAAGRAVAALHPDSTWEKTVLDPWRRETWDGGDTVGVADPREDADVGANFKQALGAADFTSWSAARTGGTFGADAEAQAANQDAATKAAAYMKTPAVAHFDSLGRVCLEIADAGGAGRLPVRSALDTHSKPLAVFDALGRRAEEHVLRTQAGYLAGADMLGRPLYRIGADAGARRALADVGGQTIRLWDNRGHAFRSVFDAARRPLRRYVSVGGAAERLLEYVVYGEGNAAANLCGRAFRHYDGAGYSETSAYDFKGNLLVHARRLATTYKQSPDWSPLAGLTDAAALDAAAGTAGLIATADGGRDLFRGSTRYDALNRPTQTTSPANAAMKPNVSQFGYDAGGHLASIDLWLQRAAAPTGPLDPSTADRRAVTATAYNARGQRASIAYGNGASTTYNYDPLTFRLTRLTTMRPPALAADAETVQDLKYFYDPVGNITRLRDDADIQNVIYFANRRVEPSNDYAYDPLYRLLSAKGREHLGQAGGALRAAAQVTDDDSIRMRLPQPGDGNAMGTYAETYSYDALGNLLTMAHQVTSGGWTRRYAYNEPSRIVAGETGNRQTATSLPGDPAAGPFTATYAHDAHGNMTRMPHLPTMTIDENDRLASTARTASANPPTTYYVYDASGLRVRKVTETVAGKASAERIYVGEEEVYREFAADGKTIELARETYTGSAGEAVAMRVETRTAGADQGPANQVRYQFANHLGSAALELGDAAEVISYEEYFPFGATSYQATANQTDVAKRYRYTGKERDEENALYYHGARYYAPWLGRWTACDPAGTVEGYNLYGFASNNPANRSDRTGLQSKDSDDNSADDDLPIGVSSKPDPSRRSILPALPLLKLDPPNFLSSSYSQSLGAITPGAYDVEANLYLSGSRFTGLGQSSQSGGGLQNAQFQVRQQVGPEGFDLGATVVGAYTSQGTITGDAATRGLGAAGLAHYSHKWGSNFGVGGYLSAGIAGQRTNASDWIVTPTFSATGVLAYEVDPPDPQTSITLKQLREPTPTVPQLRFSGVDVNPAFSYAERGQLSQGPVLHGLYSVGGYAGIGVGIGSQTALVVEGGILYSHGGADSASSSSQTGSSMTYRAGAALTYSWIERTTSGPQTSSVSIGAWWSQERGSIGASTPVGDDPHGDFVSNSIIFGATFGYRRPLSVGSF